MPPARHPTLRSTYRVQLHAGFAFDDAAAIVPYLAELGVSHLYASPVLKAAPGSTHGYDVVDHGRVNPELGGEAGFERLTDALRAAGMGLVLDIVPNHMSIAGEGNRWWWDVLQHGPASRYAGWFDVEWEPPESRLRNVILLPVLADHYGRVLEAGELRLVRDSGTILVAHGERRFPLDPRTIDTLVASAADRAASAELAAIATALGELPPSTSSDRALVAERQREADVVLARLATALEGDPAAAAAIDAAIEATNAEIDRLDALLDDQNYRLARWRAASRDLAYRRFFDINELIGLRMELPEVFEATHALPLRWVREGRVQGLRIDHPDGLRDPAGYFERLRAAAPNAWIVAEKILAEHEGLRPGWPIDGTTGYRFANLATGLLVEPSAEAVFDDTWAAAAGEDASWPRVEEEARSEVLSTILGSDVNRLADLFLAVCEENRRYRDYTRHELHHALREVAAAMPVYRTYVRVGELADTDRSLIDAAATAAAGRRPDLDAELFAFLAAILRGEISGDHATELSARFQQLTPAALAKGVEDTAFYRYHRLVALNEVGGDPGRFGVLPSRFHEHMAATHEHRPHEMLSLSTHDTKRSGDVRARLAVATQDPAAWSAAVDRLAAAAEAHRDGPELPTRADAQLFFQTLLGAWPIDADRAAAFMRKATREAKRHTSWTDPNAAYDDAVERLVRGSLGDAAFVAEVERVAAAMLDAGRRAALVQVALQFTAPGIPDLYQGGELWDLSLVDPDNRRPVDYEERRRLLAEAGRTSAAEAWARADSGLPKLWLIRRLLELRRRRPESFEPGAGGAYQPLVIAGDGAEGVVGFRRGAGVAVVAPLRYRHESLALTVELGKGRWRGLDETEHSGSVAVRDLATAFPVAVLERVG